jgi:hypothetical protein
MKGRKKEVKLSQPRKIFKTFIKSFFVLLFGKMKTREKVFLQLKLFKPDRNFRFEWLYRTLSEYNVFAGLEKWKNSFDEKLIQMLHTFPLVTLHQSVLCCLSSSLFKRKLFFFFQFSHAYLWKENITRSSKSRSHPALCIHKLKV